MSSLSLASASTLARPNYGPNANDPGSESKFGRDTSLPPIQPIGGNPTSFSLVAQLASNRPTKVPVTELHARIVAMKHELRTNSLNQSADLQELIYESNVLNLKLQSFAERTSNDNIERDRRLDHFHTRCINKSDHKTYTLAANVLLQQKSSTAPGLQPKPLPKRLSRINQLLQDKTSSMLRPGTRRGFTATSLLPSITAPTIQDLRSANRSLATAIVTSTASEIRLAVLPPIIRQATEQDRLDTIEKYPTLTGTGSKKAKTKYINERLIELANDGCTIDRGTLVGWVSSSKPSTKSILRKGKRGRPASIQATQVETALETATTQITNGGHAPSLAAVIANIQRQRVAGGGLIGEPVAVMSLSTLRASRLVIEASTIQVEKPDKNCQTIPRWKAGCYRTGIRNWAAKTHATSCARRDVSQILANENPIHPLLLGGHDDTTMILWNAHNHQYKVCVPLSKRNAKITAPQMGGGHMPQRIVLKSFMNAMGGNDQMITMNLTAKDTFRKDQDGKEITDSTQNIFKINLYGDIVLRFVRQGTSQAEYTKDGLENFIAPVIEKRRRDLAVQLNKPYDPLNIDPLYFSSVTAADGAGGNLVATVARILAGTADEKYEVFLKYGASATHCSAECDVATIYRDHKRTTYTLMKQYDALNGGDDLFNIDEKEMEDFQVPVSKRPGFWNGWEDHLAVKQVLAACSGQNSTLGFNVKKAQLLARYVYILVMTKDESFGSKRKNCEAFATTGWYPNDPKRAITLVPGFKDLTSNEQRMILSPANLERYLIEVAKDDLVTDAWFDNNGFPMSRYGLDKDGVRINRDNYPLHRQPPRNLSNGTLSEQIAAKISAAEIAEEDKQMKRFSKEIHDEFELSKKHMKAKILLQEIRAAKGVNNVVPKNKCNKPLLKMVLSYIKHVLNEEIELTGSKNEIVKRIDTYLTTEYGEDFGVEVVPALAVVAIAAAVVVVGDEVEEARRKKRRKKVEHYDQEDMTEKSENEQCEFCMDDFCICAADAADDF